MDIPYADEGGLGIDWNKVTVEGDFVGDKPFKDEEMELAKARKGVRVYGKTGFPATVKTWKLIYESYNMSIEEGYFFCVEWLKSNQGYPVNQIHKITDVFSAAEHSSFFGASQQKIGLQQDKVSQFLAIIGKMVRELFQLVRELRVIDERLGYYRASMDEDAKKGRESAEITLKGIWIDLVEGGAKNPASVYGMARELQFATLPDLFFKIHPKIVNEVDPMIDNLKFNRKVREVLKRKLRTFMEWKKHTYVELKTRRIFTLKYLRQHYDIIHMYMSWVKPYLRQIRRLQLLGRTGHPELIGAFEGSLLEIEVLASKLPESIQIDQDVKQNKKVYSVVNLHFLFRTRPTMSYQQEYQRGPLHVGRMELGIRVYAWTKEQIEKYKEVREKEDFKLLEEIDISVKAAMEALGEELEKYLKEAGDTLYDDYKKKITKEKTPTKKVKGSGIAEPFAAVANGFAEITGTKPKKRTSKGIDTVEFERKTAESEARTNGWFVYKDFKKTHRMLTW